MYQTRKPSENSTVLNNRIPYLMIGFFIIMGILVVRLFDKSVIKHNECLAIAENQYIVKKEINASRGRIYSQDNSIGEPYPLAMNIEKYELSVVPKNITDKKLVSDKLSSIINIPQEEIFNKINNDKLYLPPLAKNLDQNVANKILDLKLIGVIINSIEVRYYPENNLASQILGFVDSEGQGKYGIEGYYNDELQGNSGIVEGEKDAKGSLISLGSDQLVTDGDDLYLTVDHNVQYTAEQKLRSAIDKYQAEGGSIIIMDAKTGGILAMANAKDFDPNKYNEVKPEDQNLFLNQALSYSFEPGSIMKPIIMSMGINEGKIEPDTQNTFSNMTIVQGYEIHTAQDKAFGQETMTQCLENSDNVCMVWVADKFGNETMRNYFDSFGFGNKTSIDSDGEALGSLLKLSLWRDINRATMSFGQGIAVTPIQITNAINVIANNGNLIKPHFVDKIVKPNNEIIKIENKIVKEVISSETATKLKGMMVSVVENGHGKRAKVSGYKVAGKTGTAQVPDPNGGYYTDQTIGSFVGFLPADDPKFTMLVKLDKPKSVEWAESSAAPVFGDMAQWLLNYYKVPPTEPIN